MKLINILFISLVCLLSGCATPISGTHLVMLNQPMKKIDPNKVAAGESVYRLSARDVIQVKVEPLQTAGGTYKVDRGNQLQVVFTMSEYAQYKISPGDMLTLEFPDELEGMYEVFVSPDGKVTLPRLGKTVVASGLTIAELNKKTVRYYRSVFLSPKVSWALASSFNNRLSAMNGTYSVGAEGNITVPNLGTFDVLGKSGDTIAKILTLKARDRFKNDVSANVSVAQVIHSAHYDNRLSPSGLVMHLNPNNLPTPVADDGTIYVSTTGSLIAEGKTLQELKRDILNRVQPNYQNPVSVSVIMKQYADYNVYIGGEVNRPGRYPYARKMSMLKLIAQAGWIKQTGDLAAALLLRSDQKSGYIIYRTNLAEIMLGKGPGSQDLKITPQDLVIIPPTDIAKKNRYIAQYVRGILPFGTNVSYNFNDLSGTGQ